MFKKFPLSAAFKNLSLVAPSTCFVRPKENPPLNKSTYGNNTRHIGKGTSIMHGQKSFTWDEKIAYLSFEGAKLNFMQLTIFGPFLGGGTAGERICGPCSKFLQTPLFLK